MAKEVDINARRVMVVDSDGFAQPTQINPSDMEHFQTDVDFNVTVFLNPVYWLRIYGFWNELNGYGFVFGPFCIRVNVHRLVRFKEKEDEN